MAEQDLLPAHGETPCRIQETGRVRRKGTGDGEYDGQLAQSLHHAVQHGADGKVGEQDGGWAACVEGAAGGDEQTGTYGMSQIRQRLRTLKTGLNSVPMEPPNAIICRCLPFNSLARSGCAVR